MSLRPCAVTPRERRGPTNELLISVLTVLPRQGSGVAVRIEKILDILSANYGFYELLLVDNDAAPEVQAQVLDVQSRMPNVRLLRLSRCYAQEIALSAALDHCIGDYVVTMDLMTDQPDLVPLLVARASSGYDTVTAEYDTRRRLLWERLLLGPFCWFASRVLGFVVRPDQSYFRVFSRRFINSLVRIRTRSRYLSCLNGIVGFQHSSIRYHREDSRRPYSVRHALRQLRSAADILVANSGVPLRLASLMGVLASFANIAYLFYVLTVSLVKQHIAEGWITTSLTQTSMFLMIFLILSVLSEYIARLVDETRGQPLYFVESETTSSVAGHGRDRLNVV